MEKENKIIYDKKCEDCGGEMREVEEGRHGIVNGNDSQAIIEFQCEKCKKIVEIDRKFVKE